MKFMFFVLPTVPATLEDRKRLRPIGRNNDRYQMMLDELRKLAVLADDAGARQATPLGSWRPGSTGARDGSPTPLPHAACAPASGNCQRIDSPSSGDHGVLEVRHEPPGGGHVAGARPRSSGEVSGNDIEQRIFLDGFQSAISGCVGIAGVEGSNQLGVFLDDDPQGEVRGGSHATPFKLPPAAGQWSGQ